MESLESGEEEDGGETVDVVGGEEYLLAMRQAVQARGHPCRHCLPARAPSARLFDTDISV